MSQRKIKKLKKDLTVNVDLVEKVSDLPGFWELVKADWKFLLSMVLLALVIYFNSFAGNFVSDDYATIMNNPNVGNFWAQLNLNTFANSMNMGNYLVNMIFGNQNPIPYHIFSWIWFAISIYLGYVLTFQIIRDKNVSRISTILFVSLPIHVEAVSWIAGRIYLMISVYVLASVINFIYFLVKQKKSYLWLSCLFFVLAFCTDRPRPFAAFFAVALYLITVDFSYYWKKFGKIFLTILGIIIVAAFISWPNIISRIEVVNSGTNSSESIFYNPFFQYPTAMTKYLQLLWFPIDLTLYHTMYILPNWLNWSILLVYLVMLIYFFFKNKKYFFALAFIFAAAAPSMAPVKVSWLVAERYMFLGSLGFTLLLALIIEDLRKYFKFIPYTILASLVIIYGIRTVTRNMDWTTNHNLWVNTCQVSPNSHNAWNNIGDDYDKLKQYDNSVKGFTQSTIVKPNYADAFHNRANIFFKTGRLDLARDSYNTALYFSPNLYQTYLSLVQIDLTEKKLDLALEHASGALKIQPNDPQAAYVLAIVYAQVGRINEAEAILTNLLKQIPNYQLARQALDQLKSQKTNGSNN